MGVILRCGLTTGCLWDPFMKRWVIESYDSGLPRNVKVAAIINVDVWQWLVANSTELLTLKDYSGHSSTQPGQKGLNYLVSLQDGQLLYFFSMGFFLGSRETR